MMTVRQLVTINDEGQQLQKPSTSIQPEEFGSYALNQIVQDMCDTMMASKGTGIAAPQIGFNKQVVVFGGKASLNFSDFEVPLTVLINPSYKPVGKDQVTIWEHCLSLPGQRGKTVRFKNITYTGFDINGDPVTGEASDILAILLQHEMDHLKGKLYTCHVHRTSLFGKIKDFEKKFGENHHKEHGMKPYTKNEEEADDNDDGDDTSRSHIRSNL